MPEVPGASVWFEFECGLVDACSIGGVCEEVFEANPDERVGIFGGRDFSAMSAKQSRCLGRLNTIASSGLCLGSPVEPKRVVR